MEVLLADDDDLLASLLSFRLKKGGYKVRHTCNGKEVIEYLETHEPDFIVSDIMMPYFSGIELINYVRNDLSLNTPIIIISSAGNEENVLSAFEMGANDFITKPFSPTELLVRLERELKKT
ncbi:response regulator [Maribacter cobaltidurans]|uniref:Response regulator n=1 Tax=Maribacter cobaltidurans TaxID=1178778 RepID=A0A223VAK5_9FLAO|nr:response regulator [Maribacter cobaltidurans]ASV32190.1 response regulator [Maribacter cobaltidurans]GGD91030.1 hypothetical protein GCM10011412_31260 [Maribacter cobaltidurans]